MVSIFTSFACTHNWTEYITNEAYKFSEPVFTSTLTTMKNFVAKLKTYEICDTFLMRLDENGNRHSYLSLTLMVLEPFVEESESIKRDGFKLGSFDFYVDSAESLEKWLFYLNRRCVLTNIDEDFVFIKKIGKGSTSTVYLSEHVESKEQFAVKCLYKEHLLSHENSIASLLEEIRILREIKHNNIAQLYYVYINENCIYLVMEYLPNGTLFQRIRSKGKFDETNCAKFIKGLLETLEYLHSINIVHRDLKLENIIMVGDDDCEFKIIDFGLAYLSRATQSKKCGSPGYVAPEILKNMRYNHKIDIFSAGVILYILLVGCQPFQATKTQELLKKNAECRFAVDKNVSKSAWNVLCCMMEPNPEQRLNASELLNLPWLCCTKPTKDVELTISMTKLVI